MLYFLFRYWSKDQDGIRGSSILLVHASKNSSASLRSCFSFLFSSFWIASLFLHIFLCGIKCCLAESISTGETYSNDRLAVCLYRLLYFITSDFVWRRIGLCSAIGCWIFGNSARRNYLLLHWLYSGIQS